MHHMRVFPTVRTNDAFVVWVMGLPACPLDGIDAPPDTGKKARIVYNLSIGPAESDTSTSFHE